MQPSYYPQPQQYPQGWPVQPAGPQYPAQYPVAPGYGAPPVPPVQPSAPGSLDGFYGQPSTSGGPSFKFQGKPIGTTYVGVVERPITDADVRQQTNQQGVPQTYRDGRPKFIMVVPMLVPQSPEFPEGRAGWWVKGQARDELVRAMAEAGAPAGPPEAGAMITVTLVGQRAIPGMNPAYQYRIFYTRPTGDPAQVVAALPAPAPVVQGYPAGYPVPPAQLMAPVGPQYAAPPAQVSYGAPAAQYGPPVQPAPAQPVYAAQAAPPVAPTGVPAPTAMAAVAAGQPAPVAQASAPALGGLSPEQQALMATLVGQAAPVA